MEGSGFTNPQNSTFRHQAMPCLLGETSQLALPHVRNTLEPKETLNQLNYEANKDQLQDRIRCLTEAYCLCSSEVRKLLYNGPIPPLQIKNFGPDETIERSLQFNIEEEKQMPRAGFILSESMKTRNIIQNQTSQTNVENLQALEGYPYSSAVHPNSKNGKMVMVYKCEFNECHKTFMRTWNLLDHIRMHYGIRPYVCKFCGKGFTQKGNMRKHLIQHEKPHLSNRKKFKCEFCSSSFTERYNYRTHVEKKHGISPSIPNLNHENQLQFPPRPMN
ncbi:unnamed protein product [Moneuplotes crassus]|uniref:C2H2-type domain-containing protein n=1 Tax=Euplotes crassus TaxID=5936 RepID=A0AAD1U751_EUPCR|nr:unnamed protein product [Moneuplotes crassus]